jgi:hypothetical protein
MPERRKRTTPTHRRCPECGAERPVAEFVAVPAGRRPATAHGLWSRCPSCDHIAPKWAFRAVGPDAGTEGGEG